jgi:hypothetical protein
MRLLKLSAFALVCSVVFQGRAVAQTPPATDLPRFLQVITVKVKPSAISEYEDYVKKVIAAAVKVGAPQRVVVYQAVMGAPLGTYMASTPFNKWEEVDTWPSIPVMLNKAYGDLEGTKVLKAGRAAIDSAETNVYSTLTDRSTNPKNFDTPTAFAAVTRTELNPAMAPAYSLMLRKIKKAEEGTPDAPTVIRRAMIEGPGYVMIASRYFNKFSERSAVPNQGDLLEKVYGDDEARAMNETILQAVAKRDTWVLAYRADMSKLTAGMAATPAK